VPGGQRALDIERVVGLEVATAAERATDHLDHLIRQMREVRGASRS
jgi:hypothetical protein